MKKVSMFLGALGGAMAGYLLSNKKLREELIETDDPKKAAKILGAHLQKDGHAFAQDVKEFVESEPVQKKVKEAKKYADKQYAMAKKEVRKAVKEGQKQAKFAKRKIMNQVKTMGK